MIQITRVESTQHTCMDANGKRELLTATDGGGLSLLDPKRTILCYKMCDRIFYSQQKRFLLVVEVFVSGPIPSTTFILFKVCGKERERYEQKEVPHWRGTHASSRASTYNSAWPGKTLRMSHAPVYERIDRFRTADKRRFRRRSFAFSFQMHQGVGKTICSNNPLRG